MLPAGVVALGLVQGALAAFDALALVLLWRSSRILNLAQPSLGLVGGVLTGLLVTGAGWSFWWAAPVGLAVGAALGVATDRVVLRRLEHVPRAVLIVATVALAQLFGALAVSMPFLFGGPLPTYTIALGVSVDLFPVRLLGPHLLALAALPVAWVGTHLFLHRSRLGLAALALGQEQERARALGVPARLVRSVVWAVAGVLASFSGILSIPVLGFNLGGGLGPLVLLLSLTPAVLAGLRSIHGAVLACLGVGVAYQAALWYAPRSGIADLALGAAIVVAIALQRRQLGRAGAARHASSWEAALTPRPLPASLRNVPAVRAAAVAAAAAAVVGAAALPEFLEPSLDVAYGTVAAFGLAALGVAAAWMYAGEISLGHWGFAGLGAVIALLVPGPWPARVVAATIALGCAGAGIAMVARRRAPLAFAVVTLAVAAVAPALGLRVAGRHVPAAPGSVASATAIACVVVAIALVLLRRTRTGARMIAARDEPGRAPALGADVVRSRVAALTVSTAIAGAAGALYACALPTGLVPGGLDATRSFDLLSLAVIGGLGSPFGALLATIAVRAGRLALPGTWGALLSGGGMLIVVLFLPGGLGGAIARARGVMLRTLRPAPSGAARAPGEAA